MQKCHDCSQPAEGGYIRCEKHRAMAALYKRQARRRNTLPRRLRAHGDSRRNWDSEAADLITEARRLGWSFQRIADQMGIDHRTVSKLSGEPRRNTGPKRKAA